MCSCWLGEDKGSWVAGGGSCWLCCLLKKANRSCLFRKNSCAWLGVWLAVLSESMSFLRCMIFFLSDLLCFSARIRCFSNYSSYLSICFCLLMLTRNFLYCQFLFCPCKCPKLFLKLTESFAKENSFLSKSSSLDWIRKSLNCSW